MKSTKILLILFAVLTVLSCKKDDDGGGNSFLLTPANLAGLYDLIYLTSNIEQTVEVNGIPVMATTDVVGDTFQIDMVFNENGTYTVEGQYRITVTVTVAGMTETTTEIIVLDEAGDYTLDANAQTITLSGANGELGDGVFDITLYNETEFRIVQVETITANGVDADVTNELRFVRQ